MRKQIGWTIFWLLCAFNTICAVQDKIWPSQKTLMGFPTGMGNTQSSDILKYEVDDNTTCYYLRLNSQFSCVYRGSTR